MLIIFTPKTNRDTNKDRIDWSDLDFHGIPLKDHLFQAGFLTRQEFHSKQMVSVKNREKQMAFNIITNEV